MRVRRSLGNRRVMIHRGLSAYPSDPYFDPNRPSWLPYWIDDFTESAAKYGTSGVLAAVPAAAVSMGQAAGSAVGGVVGGAAGGAVESAVSGALSSPSGSAFDWTPVAFVAAGLIGAAMLMGRGRR